MTDLDLTRYEGHTPGPWLVRALKYKTIYNSDTFIEPGVAAVWATGPDAALIADAPLLLAEVRRLRDENAALNGQLEQQLRRSEMASMKEADRLAALCQSHERLLAAIKADADRVMPNGRLCWCGPKSDPHEWWCVELREAVSEAEAL